jgi:hypothetical protein
LISPLIPPTRHAGACGALATALQCGATSRRAGVPAAGAEGGVAVGSEHGFPTPDGAYGSHIKGRLVFGGRPVDGGRERELSLVPGTLPCFSVPGDVRRAVSGCDAL